MHKVLDQYAKHIVRLKQKQSVASRFKRSLGIAYYISAALAIQALIATPKPAWVGLKFEKSRVL